ncbi:MAG TPA: hypothetical protein VJQ56_08825 [Blastocatellia bacterium]|nr:hypothetical protein [Blastocatellia bacterium]
MTLTALILEKLREQVELTDHLVSLVPEERLEWRPVADSFRVCDLLGHLLESLSGFAAVLYALHPERLAHLLALHDRQVNHCCQVEEARAEMSSYLDHIAQGFTVVSDEDLLRRLPTLFVPEGEAGLTLILNNLEHLINHKHQLFFYLKLLAVPVATADLYRIRKLD